MVEFTLLNITPALEKMAEHHGAYFMKDVGWVIEGEVPEALLSFVPKNIRHRDYVKEAQEECDFMPQHSFPEKSIQLPDNLKNEIERITRRAHGLFRNADKTKKWLATPKVALQQRTPLEAMTDLNGCRVVDNLLTERFL